MSSKPTTHKILQVEKLTTNFREAVVLHETDVCKPKNGEVCVKNKYVGINIADINITKGRYFVDGKVPFGVGVEGIGEVVEVGDGVDNLKVGQCVAYINGNMNSYAEYTCVPTAGIFPIPNTNPELVGIIISGLTASVGLDKCANLKSGETVLITAAAGGTGHLAVQWAKAAGCHIIGICSSDEKLPLLKELGCDRAINYKKENLDEVLTKEYKDGINVIWETIAGEVFLTCFKHLARKGRLLVVGGTSGYANEENVGIMPKMDISHVPEQLLFKSASLHGFLLSDFKECYETYFKRLMEKFEKGELKSIFDIGERSEGGKFFGVEDIIRAVEYVVASKNIGKVIVQLS